MDARGLGNSVLSNCLGNALLATSSGLLVAGSRLLYIDPLRKPLFRVLDRRLAAREKQTDAIGRQRTLIYRAVLHTVNRLIERRA